MVASGAVHIGRNRSGRHDAAELGDVHFLLPAPSGNLSRPYTADVPSVARVPMTAAAWDASVAWFDVKEASRIFLESCGSGVVLVSIEVSRPDKREICAYFGVPGHNPPVYTTISTVCGGGKGQMPHIAKLLGEHAARFARMC